ncbi:alpha/beta-hydrolase [Jaminaea rosea]|uniref:Alpha/beta-hydrolase n=1 Tax=Jaminaea rosea TaxID=1569628 RepID=A0A316UPT8_9BASI|nr:alpha/beta-hydrolase [Jaminaea rosea]PWN27290.1 alpha/beta-hydrolase [Jaminaea rosea]
MPNKLGNLAASDTGKGAYRVTVPYAQAPVGQLRFANPQPITSLSKGFDPTKTPPSCYQGDGDPRGGNEASEDCLYLTVYFPKSMRASSKLPVFMWLPGGSFVGGSASNAGLDGSTLASEQNMIVIVAQYRLGLFGWLQTADIVDEKAGGAPGAAKVAGNQAARDINAALQFVHDYFGPFGADTSRVTLSGQSSGAHMVRSLLTIPSAAPLFQQALLVSDTENYGAATQLTQNKLGTYAMAQLKCTDLACARNASADDVLDASYAAFSDVPLSDPSIPAGEPWRPTQGAYMTTTIEKDPATALQGGKKIVLTTITNESGASVANLFAHTEPNAQTLRFNYADHANFTLPLALDLYFIAARGDLLLQQPAYALNTTLVAQEDGLRTTLEQDVTDGLWRCSTQFQARSLSSAAGGAGNVWLAQHQRGYTYPSNADFDYCQAKDVHCHEDDIYLIFGTTPGNADAATKATSKELRARYGAFVRGGNPNSGNYVKWGPVAGDDNLNVLYAGSGADGSSSVSPTQRKDHCQGVWGKTVKFDWQIYS